MERPEQLTDVVTDHGEGPFWDAAGQRLLVVDMLAGDVVDLADPAAPVRHRVGGDGGVAATVRARRGGGFVVATEHDVVLTDAGLEPSGAAVRVLEDARLRFNDGACDPWGRFWCGTMAYDESPGAGSLHRLRLEEGRLRSEVVLEGVTISNGLQWRPDRAAALYADTPTGRVDLLETDPGTGELGQRRPFARVPEGRGLPDGLCLDAEGGVWVALWGGGGLVRFDADGRLSAVVDLPTPQVTACAFGGEDLSVLHVTTSRTGRGPDDRRAGAVFALRPGVRGLPLDAFAG